MRRQQNLSTGTAPWFAALAFAALTLASSPCASQSAKQLRIGVQFGLGYLPLYVADVNHLFEQRMREQGVAPVPVEIVHVAGGPQINDGLLSGTFEMGSGGYTAMMVSWDKTRNAGDSRLLGVTALSSVPYDLFSTDAQVSSVKDLSRERDKIGVPSVKVSVPAIYLQMEAERLFGTGQHTALDDLTVSLRSPTGDLAPLGGHDRAWLPLLAPVHPAGYGQTGHSQDLVLERAVRQSGDGLDHLDHGQVPAREPEAVRGVRRRDQRCHGAHCQ
jgi:hypothetical protein